MATQKGFITLFFFFLLLLLPLELVFVDAQLVVTGSRRILASKAGVGSDKSTEEDESGPIPVNLKQKKVKTDPIIKEAVKLKKPTNASYPLLKKNVLLLNQTIPASWKPVKKATDLQSPEKKNKTAAVEKKVLPTTMNGSHTPEKEYAELSEDLVIKKKKKKIDDSKDAELNETPVRKKKKLEGGDSQLLKPSTMKNKTMDGGEKKKTPTAIKDSLKQENIDSSEGVAVKKKKVEDGGDGDTEQPPIKKKKKKKIDLLEPDASVKVETPIKTNATVPTKKNLTPSPLKKSTTVKEPKKPKSAKPRVDEEDDLVADFRSLPLKFHENIVPDLGRISTTGKAYLNKANREMVEGFKPLVGRRYAPVVATVTSYVFLLLPLALVSFLFHQIHEYLSLQKLLFFIHGYLGAYFTVLTLAFAFFRVEPLRFFYESSLSSYVFMVVMQTLFYVMYLLMLVLYMVVQFSTATGLEVRVAALAQSMVGAAVGLHYYSAVFHNALLHRAPRATWKSHACYALCFLMLSLIAKRVMDRSKKAYYHESDNGDKKS